MYCSKCGTQLKDDALFCYSCGNKIEKTKHFCRICRSNINPEMEFCMQCGEPIYKIDKLYIQQKKAIEAYKKQVEEEEQQIYNKRLELLDPYYKDKDSQKSFDELWKRNQQNDELKLVLMLLAAPALLLVATLITWLLSRLI